MTKEEKPKTAIQMLRDAEAVMAERVPGKPAVELPLDAIITFQSSEGETKAVIHVEQVIFLVDAILRNARAGRA
jgi:hypothetical protein